jgi:hypothetical protein
VSSSAGHDVHGTTLGTADGTPIFEGLLAETGLSWPGLDATDDSAVDRPVGWFEPSTEPGVPASRMVTPEVSRSQGSGSPTAGT